MIVGEMQIKMLTDEELDRLLVEIILKMSPGQRTEAAKMVFAAAEEVQETKEAS
jgi:hypothetical protein